jgi:hypothetical protein
MKGKNRDTFKVCKVKPLLDMSACWIQPEKQKEHIAKHEMRIFRFMMGYTRIYLILNQTIIKMLTSGVKVCSISKLPTLINIS